MKQRGAALIMVLMIIAIVVVIVVQMTGRLQLQLQRQQTMQQQHQAFWYAMAAEEFTRIVLTRTVIGQETVNLSQEWALQGAVFAVDDGNISGTITDLQSCFNLNALQSAVVVPQQEAEQGQRRGRRQVQQPVARRSFQRLLEQALPDLNIPAEALTMRIADWLDEDSLLSSAGSAEDDDYAALVFPYYSANSLMVSETELRVILEVTPDDYRALQPYICVIPENDTLLLNVNTLTEDNAVLLTALIPELSTEAAQQLITDRPEEGFADPDAFFSSGALNGIAIPDDVRSLFTVTSSYFRLTAVTAYQETGFVLTSVFKVDGNNVRVVSRRYGGLE